MTKAEKLKAWALAQVGSPYVMGGTGQPCTPAYRRARAEQYPDSAKAIRRNCPVMGGKQATCAGCKYDGKRCYDCAQLVRRGCAAAGIEGVAISGATSQWRKGDWLRKGGVEDAPSGKMCILFREDKPGTMGHVGIALGDGTIVHASGHDTGVIRTAISAGRWTHYAIPRGMDAVVDGGADAPSEGDNGGIVGTDQRDMIRRGAKGPTVVEAQGLLLRAGYSLPKHGADGSFGAETEAAVKAFQQAHGLTADGIVGPKTWAALGRAAASDSTAADTYTVIIPGLSREEAKELAGLYTGATITEGGGLSPTKPEDSAQAIPQVEPSPQCGVSRSGKAPKRSEGDSQRPAMPGDGRHEGGSA